MGGNNPLIAQDVANLDAAVHHIVQSAFVSLASAVPARGVRCCRSVRRVTGCCGA